MMQLQAITEIEAHTILAREMTGAKPATRSQKTAPCCGVVRGHSQTVFIRSTFCGC